MQGRGYFETNIYKGALPINKKPRKVAGIEVLTKQIVVIAEKEKRRIVGDRRNLRSKSP